MIVPFTLLEKCIFLLVSCDTWRCLGVLFLPYMGQMVMALLNTNGITLPADCCVFGRVGRDLFMQNKASISYDILKRCQLSLEISLYSSRKRFCGLLCVSRLHYRSVWYHRSSYGSLFKVCNPLVYNFISWNRV